MYSFLPTSSLETIVDGGGDDLILHPGTLPVVLEMQTVWCPQESGGMKLDITQKCSSARAGQKLNPDRSITSTAQVRWCVPSQRVVPPDQQSGKKTI